MARGKMKTVIDTAHPHTIKKFELIEEYIKSWAQKLMLYENCNTLVFIDCMCNSGVYFDDDGNLIDGTSVLVANALLNVARKYPSKMVQLYLNDINKEKVEELRKHIPANERNFQIITTDLDAGVLLRTMLRMKKKQTEYLMRRTRRIHLRLTRVPATFWKKPSAITIRCSIQTILRIAISSKATIRMSLSV